jgi:hypothetical protein
MRADKGSIVATEGAVAMMQWGWSSIEFKCIQTQASVNTLRRVIVKGITA